MKPRNIFIAIILVWGFVAQDTGFAQNEKLKWYQDRFTYFYRDPRPERLTGLVEKWQSDSGGRWDAYPPLVGFLAIVFKDHPEWIDRLIPSKLTQGSATAVTGALRLAGDPPISSESRLRIAQAGVDPVLRKQLEGFLDK